MTRYQGAASAFWLGRAYHDKELDVLREPDTRTQRLILHGRTVALRGPAYPAAILWFSLRKFTTVEVRKTLNAVFTHRRWCAWEAYLFTQNRQLIFQYGEHRAKETLDPVLWYAVLADYSLLKRVLPNKYMYGNNGPFSVEDL